MDKLSNEHIEQAVLKVLKYYDYFHYPLTPAEIYFNFPYEESQGAIERALQELVTAGIVFKTGPAGRPAHTKSHAGGDLYSLQKNAELIERRIKGNELAGIKLKKAYKVARFINAFPFVKTVFISGSLSKNYADERTDLDFFICTDSNKLWIARTFLHLFKKLTFLMGRQHDFCMNYFLDIDHLQIEEQNIYTAIELATLKPHKKNDEILYELLRANDWIKEYLPNFYKNVRLRPADQKKKNWYTFLFDNKWFDAVNVKLMQITDRHWRRKWSKRNFPMQEYALAFKTRPYVSKNHPHNYQKKVLEHYKAAGYHE